MIRTLKIIVFAILLLFGLFMIKTTMYLIGVFVVTACLIALYNVVTRKV